MTEENHLISQRREKLSNLREQGFSFPNNPEFMPNTNSAEILDMHCRDTKEDLERVEYKYSIAGRMMLDRRMFKVIQDGHGRMQIYASKDIQKSMKSWDIGDIGWFEGRLCRSNTDDLYIKVENFQLLTKSVRPLPEKHSGLVDQESRYRQRYVDLIMNENSRNVFIARQQVINEIRNFFVGRGYFEAETPMLQAIPGGASAKPFITHHNSLDMEMYLRIAPELFLKRLVVGGFNKVFEINRNFRNEGLSTRHNPEFTMVEFYQAYSNYEDLMDMTEEMLRRVAGVARVFMKKVDIEFQGEILDFNSPFERLSMTDSIVKYNDSVSSDSLESLEGVKETANRLGVAFEEGDSWGVILNNIFEQTVEESIKNPTFIVEYPADVSPLARRCDHDERITERFELFIAGREIANGFSELNDYEDQAERFKQQAANKANGDVEAMYYDEDYINALEYGMPPTAGEGIGIDRLVMLLTDSPSIRDVILFPQMRQT